MDITISQTEPISSLPKDYSRLLKKAQREKKPIVLLRRNRPVGALVGWEWLEKAIKQEKLFRQDAFHPSLHTYKLAGKLANYWSFRINYHTRIVFRFLSQNEILFVDTGSYDIYK